MTTRLTDWLRQGAACGALALLLTGAHAAPIKFNVPAQAAGKALIAFSQQASVEVLFSFDDLQKVHANAVVGEFEPDDALNRLLQDTGFAATRSPAGKYVVAQAGDPPAAATTAAVPVQTVPAATPSQEEVLTLPEFSVQASSSVNSYSAGDTRSSSRMNAAVKDLPYSVSSLTQAFLQDFQIFDLNEDMAYVSSALTGNQDSISYVIRGYSSGTIAIVNGHYRYAPLVAPFVDRVEVLAGPADSLYGQGSPGGGILISTNQPTSTQQDRLRLSTASSYNFNAASIHSSGPIPIKINGSPKFFYDVDAEYLHRTYDVQGARRIEKATMGVLTWRPDDKTNLTVGGTWQKYWNPTPNDLQLPLDAFFGNNPYTGKTGQIYYTGLAWPLRYSHYASSTDYVSREASEADVTLQHRFTEWLSLEASYSRYTSPTECYNTLSNSGVYFPSVGLVASTTAASGTNNVNPAATANPSWSTTMGTSYSYNINLLAHFPIGSHIDNQLLFTVDDFLNNRKNYTEAAIAGIFTPYVWAFNPFAKWTQSPYDPRDLNHWVTTTSQNDGVNSLGGGFNDRMAFNNNKFILTFGARNDTYTGQQINPTQALSAVSYPGAAPGTGHETHVKAHGFGDNLGLTYELTPALSWYASYYVAWAPFGTSNPTTVTLTGNQFAQQQEIKTLAAPPTRAEGEETGFKYDLNHEITFNIAAFDTHQKNVQVTELSDPTNPTSTTVSVPEGDQTATGVDLSSEYSRGGLDIRIGYSYTNAKVENQGINVLANGKRPRGTPYDNMVASVSYAVPQIKGLRLLSAMHAQGNSPQQSPSTGLILDPATGLFDQYSNGQPNLRAPGFTVWSFGTVYAWKTGGFTNSVNLTVRNAFNAQYIISGNGSYVGDKRVLYGTYTISY